MTSKLVAVYSNSFLPSDTDTWSASPSTALLAEIHANGIDSARWIAKLSGPSGEIRVALGDPVPSGGRQKDIYIPPWLLSTIGVEGVGEELLVKFERCETFEKATKLIFTYLGELPGSIDMKELLEHPLTQLGVLSQGQILPVPVLEGNLIVSQCEPEGVPVLLDGNEIAFDIQGDVKEVNPIPEPVPESTQSGMLPESLLSPQGGPYRVSTTSSRGRFAGRSTFQPFSGQGRTLGS
jgi:hypothetical protein